MGRGKAGPRIDEVARKGSGLESSPKEEDRGRRVKPDLEGDYSPTTRRFRPPTASRSASFLSVRSQVKSLSLRPK